MYEIRSNDGKRFAVHDPDTDEWFTLQEGARYKGKPARPFRTEDVYKITQVWNLFGGSGGDYEMTEVKG